MSLVSSMLNALSAETMKSETSDSSNGLTLIRLRMWMQNPLERYSTINACDHALTCHYCLCDSMNYFQCVHVIYVECVLWRDWLIVHCL